jgi:hypothetical protein
MKNIKLQHSSFEVKKEKDRIVFHSQESNNETKISVCKRDAQTIANEIIRLIKE